MLPARGAERQPDRGLAAPRDGAGQQQVGDVGAGDQQHQRAHAEQDAQAAAVLLAHDADAGAGRDDRDRLLRQILDHAGHPVGRVAGIVLQPLAQDAGQPRAHAVGRRVRLQPADHAQPRRHRLAQQRRLAGDQRLLVQRDPQVRRIAAQRLAEEAGAGHADDRERVPLEDEGGADDLRIGAVGARPGVMAHDDHRRGRRGVVGRRDDAAAERGHAEGREVVAADVAGSQRPRRLFDARPPCADAALAGLEGRQLLELRQVGLQPLEQRIREHAPAILGAALHAAVVAVADAVEPGRVADRQRPQHHRVDQREDRGRAADADGQRQHRGDGEDAGGPELPQRVADVADERGQSVLLPSGRRAAAGGPSQAVDEGGARWVAGGI